MTDSFPRAEMAVALQAVLDEALPQADDLLPTELPTELTTQIHRRVTALLAPTT